MKRKRKIILDQLEKKHTVQEDTCNTSPLQHTLQAQKHLFSGCPANKSLQSTQLVQYKEEKKNNSEKNKITHN